jgi:hypothetical protein
MTNVSDERAYESLSFVGSAAEIWAPARTGEYAKDCQMGRLYARELLQFMQTRGYPPFLGHVFQAMVTRGKFEGVEIGFCNEIALQASRDVRSEERETPPATRDRPHLTLVRSAPVAESVSA